MKNSPHEIDLLQELIMHSSDNPNNIGLFRGKMGYALVIAHYGRYHRMRYLDHVANMLVEQIVARISKSTPIDLSDGLAGIGWGIEFLLDNGYMKGDSSLILKNIDDRFMLTDVLRIRDESLEKGFLGMLHYICYHRQNVTRCGKPVFDNGYISNVLKRAYMTDNPEIIELAKCISENKIYFADINRFINVDDTASGNLSLADGIAGKLERSLSKTALS